jgi:hypothetical protein
MRYCTKCGVEYPEEYASCPIEAALATPEPPLSVHVQELARYQVQRDAQAARALRTYGASSL